MRSRSSKGQKGHKNKMWTFNFWTLIKRNFTNILHITKVIAIWLNLFNFLIDFKTDQCSKKKNKKKKKTFVSFKLVHRTIILMILHCKLGPGYRAIARLGGWEPGILGDTNSHWLFTCFAFHPTTVAHFGGTQGYRIPLRCTELSEWQHAFWICHPFKI